MRSGVLVAVLALLAVLPLLPHLGRRAPGAAVPGHAGVGPLEAATLATERADRPTRQRPVAEVPPAAAWWPKSEEAAAPPALGPRLLSALMVALSVAAACRAGSQLGGTRAGLLAGATLLGSPALWAWGRAATPATLQLAASLLAVAGALTAIRPFKPPARVARLASGWALAGVGLAVAALAGGAAAALPPAAAVVVLVVLSPRRLGDAAGLLAAACLAVLLVIPWLLPASPGAAVVASLFPAAPTGGTGGFSGVAVDLGRALGPWLPLVACAAVLPFTGQVKRQGTAGRLIHGWALALVALAACLPLAGGWAGPGATLFAAAACSVAVGQALSAMAEAAETGRRMWLWRGVSIASAVGLLLASVLLGWTAQLAELPAATAWMPPLAEAAGTPLAGAIALAVLAGVLACASAVPAWGDRPVWAAAAFAAWAWLVLMGLSAAGASGGTALTMGVPA
ncbi:hypothetical protein PSMK_18870 [Phycisphaera mikurensis NBRC 102666]|uniref:Uncharacterized protein n=1 Tax=Phycisphaera mikurensis (strain NBRC 102666 / KCTC 22515 / FYK2301M01) TaxID=1142394 RepID=I0IFK8_PHYMF|nr:hypothetical protein PSMK_18870 [Phycisphaera mikurensis NBRC 102666]